MQRIFVAGHTGLAGSAVCRALMVNGTGELLLQTHTQLELTDARAVDRFFARERPDRVVMCAAKVGGIQANIDELNELLPPLLGESDDATSRTWCCSQA